MASVLKNIFGLFSKGSQSVLGVDVGSSAIKIVQLRKQSGRAVLETYGELALGPYGGGRIGHAVALPPEKIIEALADVIKEANVTTSFAGLSIPLSASLVALIELPVVTESQLAQMVPIEARKYIPVPVSEVILDWFVVPKSEKELNQNAEEHPASSTPPVIKNEVLLVAIHNETINRYQSLVQSLSLNTSFFEIEIFSTIRSCLDNERTPVLICDIGAAATKIVVVDGGIIRVSHIINRGSQEVTMAIARAANVSLPEAESKKREFGLALTIKDKSLQNVLSSSVGHIIAEVGRVMSDFNRKNHKVISNVVISGGGGSLKGLKELAKQELSVEVKMADPFSKVDTPAFLQPVLQSAGPEFSVAIGLALRKLQELS
ncbi:MAG: type IV pilus assembly protein PilM [bacterium]|nr:type IV pilus assembly protein PilM [bacterium]